MPSSTELIREERAAGVRWLTIDRPDRGNSLSAALRGQLIGELSEADDDLSVRVLVLTGAGQRHFCTGADLRAPRPELRPPDGQDGPAAGNVVRGLEREVGAQRLVTALLDCRVPVVAAVNGLAAGLGAQLALACDLVIAAESASFSEIAVRRGILPDGGAAYLLPRLVGMQRAKELLLLGDDVPADRAHQMGMVNRVTTADELAATALELAERLARAPTATLALTKRLVNASFETDRTMALRLEALSEEVVMASHDGQEGFRSYVERRPTQFRGW